MFKPSSENSASTRKLIESIFARRVPNRNKYIIAYAYYMKHGLFGKKVFSYVVGFSMEYPELVIIKTDSDGHSGNAVLLKKDQIVSAKRGRRGDTKIITTGETYQFVVPTYTPTTLEASFILPIIQEAEAKKFMAFIKSIS